MENLIENHIINFIHILRSAGLTLGISEMIDALRVMTLLDMTDRDQMYRGLSSVLVKNEHDAAVFDDTFRAYFVPQAVRDQQMSDYMDKKQDMEEARDDLVFKDKPLDLSEKDLETYGAMSEEERQKIRDFIQKTNDGVNVTESLKPILEQSVKSALQRKRDMMSGEQLVPIETTGVDEWDAVLYDMARKQENKDLLMKNIADIKEEEMKEAVILIRQLARHLATRIGRRYKSSSGRQIVDVRRSIRNSLRYGGALMELKYKKKRIQKPNIILITDISGSMLKYSGFLLELMYGLSAVLPNMKGFVFAEHLNELNLKHFNIENFSKNEEIGDGTNLNNSLLEFLADYDIILNRKTVLIILSDTKTVQYLKAADKLKYIGGKVKEILWLNPIAAEDWDRYVQTLAFLPYVSMFEASSIRKLTRALRNI
ncbi:MAG TPA: VWA domain-containing protein [Clostridiales bacterium]|nr:VWA domain-containing protein [Clostridiales bacterium]